MHNGYEEGAEVEMFEKLKQIAQAENSEMPIEKEERLMKEASEVPVEHDPVEMKKAPRVEESE